MTRFTDSPYERMMTRRPEGGKETSRPPSLSPGHPFSFVMIMTVYGRFFKLYMYTALAPVPLSTFAGEPTQSVGVSFIKS